MKKLLILLVFLLIAGGGAAWYLLQPPKPPAPPPVFSSSFDFPVMPVPVLMEDKVQGQLFLKISLLFNSEEKEDKTKRFAPILFDHMLREMHDIAPHKAVINGQVDQAILEMRLQRVADDLLGESTAIVRIKSLEFHKAASP